MTTDSDPDGENGSGDDSRDQERAEPEGRGIDPDVARNVEAFRSLQRHIAGIDFSAILGARRAIEASLASVNTAAILEVQKTISRNIARSIDFSRLQQAANQALAASANLPALAELHQRWARTVASSIDLSALQKANEALLSSAAFGAAQRLQTSWAETLARQVDFGALADKLTLALPKIDVSRWVELLERWIPVNLRKVDDLGAVAQLALDEGIPLAWVPRAEVVETLLAAKDPGERAAVLEERFAEILDDCEAELSGREHEWAHQCLAAVSALRAGHEGPAQSHGANIIDSIVLRLMGRNGREDARRRAEEGLDDLPLQLVAESLTLRPLFRAFMSWWPTSGTAPPEHFARHPTAHAVGHEGLFGRLHALVAVMLATSLTIQFSDELAGEPEPPGP